jgi:peptidoglycan/LPS O-acetylase OafA/YrhL
LGLLATLLGVPERHLMLPAGVAGYFVAKAIETKIMGAWTPILLLLSGIGLGLYYALSVAWAWGWPSFGAVAMQTAILVLMTAGILSSVPTELPRWLAPVRLLGESGYSFYLLHGSITKVMLVLLFPGFGYQLAAPTDLVVALAVCFGAAVVGSQILYRMVELPLREKASAIGEVVLSAAEQKQVIESLQRPTQARYSREESRYR